MEQLKNSINWFEIPVSNFDRAKAFFCAIYDYEMPEVMMGETKMGFLLVEQGGIGGAICFGDGYVPSAEGALIYLNGGEDLSTVLSRIPDAGGKVIVEKTQISPELGFFAVFMDTEGNKLALHSMS